MKIKLAKSSGFCMGVRRAMEIALEALNNRDGPIYSYGPLIHNPQALDMLAAKGLKVINSGEGVPSGVSEGTVIIRAHGIPPKEKRHLSQTGLEVVDATCPRVIRVQEIIRRNTSKGYTSIIVGNADHPEVVALLGHADGRGLVR